MDESCIRIDDRGLTWRHQICTEGSGRTGLLLQQLKDVNYLQPPYASKYPTLVAAPMVQPCKPTAIYVVNNNFCNTSDEVVHAPPGVLTDALNSFTDNFLDFAAFDASGTLASGEEPSGTGGWADTLHERGRAGRLEGGEVPASGTARRGKEVLRRLKMVVKRLESSLVKKREHFARAFVRGAPGGARGRSLARGARRASKLQTEQAIPPLVPLPASYSHGHDTLLVSASFSIAPPQDAPYNPDLVQAIKRYQRITMPRAAVGRVLPLGGTDCMLRRVTVLVSDRGLNLGSEMDESYTMSIPSAAVCKRGGLAAVLRAKTTVGALRGLETLSQLVAFDLDTKAYHIKGVPWKIADAPRFPHRELLIDSARHWLPVATVKAVVAALPFVKINVLHWHIVDSQAFPLEIKSAPRLATKGAYSSQERYTAEDIAEVSEFARLHGVRLVPEIDTPAHAASWCDGHPEICPSAQGRCREPLSPIMPTAATPKAADATFDVVKAVLSEVGAMFADDLVHLGGDEVKTDCWREDGQIRDWLLANGNMTAAGRAAVGASQPCPHLDNGRRWGPAADCCREAC